MAQALSACPQRPHPPATPLPASAPPLPAGAFRAGPIEEPAAPAEAAAIIEEEIRISADTSAVPPLDPAPPRATTEVPPRSEPTARRAPSHAATEPVSGIRTWEGPDGGASGGISRGPLGATGRVRFLAPGSSELSMRQEVLQQHAYRIWALFSSFSFGVAQELGPAMTGALRGVPFNPHQAQSPSPSTTSRPTLNPCMPGPSEFAEVQQPAAGFCNLPGRLLGTPPAAPCCCTTLTALHRILYLVKARQPSPTCRQGQPVALLR